MKPLIIIPPDLVSPEDVKKLDEMGLCVVVAKDPSMVKFVDPIPTLSNRTEIEAACIEFTKRMLGAFQNGAPDQGQRNRMFVECLAPGTPLDPNPPKTQAQLDKIVYDDAHYEEVRKIAREDARAERAARKQAEAEKTKK